MKFSSIFLLGLVLVNVCKADDIVVDVDLEELAQADMSGALSDRLEIFESLFFFTFMSSVYLIIKLEGLCSPEILVM